ncbi:MAG: PilZ domain-containing protein [Thermodesulfovibrionales bacterium]
MSENNDNRRYRRYFVDGMHGNLLYSSDLEVLNISIDGAAIETTKRLELNREYTFKIKYKDVNLTLKGRVVWAILISKEKKDSQNAIPVYRAGVAFTDTLSEKANMLLDFIEENKIKTFENRIGSVRFKITKTENIKIDLPHRYKVKKISLTGMLAETEYPLEIDSFHDIELFLNDSVVNIVGRIANSEKLEAEKTVMYDTGIEFMQMSDRDIKLLENYLETLEDA